MNRRQWLQRVSAGIVGACVVAQVPTAWLPAPVRTYAACEFLLRHYRAWVNAHHQPPRVMVVDSALYEAYEAELTAAMRITWVDRDGPPGVPLGLMFKGVRVRRSQIDGNGWRVVMVGAERPA